MKAATTPSPSFSPDRPWMAERAMLSRPPHPRPAPAQVINYTRNVNAGALPYYRFSCLYLCPGQFFKK